MKMLRYPVIAVVAGLLIASASQVRAGGSDSCCAGSCCHDGIAASPKVRATLNDRCKSRCAAPAQVTKTTTSQAGVAASPKAQAQLSERRQTVEIAPLK